MVPEAGGRKDGGPDGDGGTRENPVEMGLSVRLGFVEKAGSGGAANDGGFRRVRGARAQVRHAEVRTQGKPVMAQGGVAEDPYDLDLAGARRRGRRWSLLRMIPQSGSKKGEVADCRERRRIGDGGAAGREEDETEEDLCGH